MDCKLKRLGKTKSSVSTGFLPLLSGTNIAGACRRLDFYMHVKRNLLNLIFKRHSQNDRTFISTNYKNKKNGPKNHQKPVQYFAGHP